MSEGPVSDSALSVRYVTGADRPIVAVAGEIDLCTAAKFRAALEQALDGHDRLEVDLRQTSFMDSTGLAILVAASQRLGRVPGALVLRHPNPMIRRLLEISGMDELIVVENDGSGSAAGGATGDEVEIHKSN